MQKATVFYDRKKILLASDKVATMILQVLVPEFRRCPSNPGVFIFDGTKHDEKEIRRLFSIELEVIDGMWRETVNNYLESKRAHERLEPVFVPQ